MKKNTLLQKNVLEMPPSHSGDGEGGDCEAVGGVGGVLGIGSIRTYGTGWLDSNLAPYSSRLRRFEFLFTQITNRGRGLIDKKGTLLKKHRPMNTSPSGGRRGGECEAVGGVGGVLGIGIVRTCGNGWLGSNLASYSSRLRRFEFLFTQSVSRESGLIDKKVPY